MLGSARGEGRRPGGSRDISRSCEITSETTMPLTAAPAVPPRPAEAGGRFAGGIGKLIVQMPDQRKGRRANVRTDGRTAADADGNLLG